MVPKEAAQGKEVDEEDLPVVEDLVLPQERNFSIFSKPSLGTFSLRPALAPTELNVANGPLLKVLCPLYDTPEAAVYWWRTNDLCFLFEKEKRRSGAAQEVTYIQIGDPLNCGNKASKELEDFEAQFLTKGREFSSENSVLRLNGATISRKEGYIRVS